MKKNQGVGGSMLTGFDKSLELNSAVTIKIDGDDQMENKVTLLKNGGKPIKT